MMSSGTLARILAVVFCRGGWTGAAVTHLSGQIRGDTAEAYAHGVRLLADAPSGDGAQAKQPPADHPCNRAACQRM